MNLTKILRAHKLWLYRKDSKYAKRADLHDANLRRIDLRRADLYGGASLRRADLRGAKNIFIMPAGKYQIIICNGLIGLGCMWHTLDEWLKMDISEVHKYDKDIDAKWFADLQGELPGLVRLAELWFKLK